MYQQISSIFTKTNLFIERNLTIEIENEEEERESEERNNLNHLYENNTLSPSLTRNNSYSSTMSPLGRFDFNSMTNPTSTTTRSRNNSFVNNLNFPTPLSRPTSGRFNLNSIFFSEVIFSSFFNSFSLITINNQQSTNK